VTADNQAVTYGGGVPALTCKHTGLAHGGASDSTAGGLAATANSGSAAGGYPVTQGTLAGTGDYTVATFHGGTPAANPATLVYEKLKRLPADAGLGRRGLEGAPQAAAGRGGGRGGGRGPAPPTKAARRRCPTGGGSRRRARTPASRG
jgi:hypothetical protein